MKLNFEKRQERLLIGKYRFFCVAAIVGGAALATSVYGASQQKKAASSAAQSQTQSAEAGIAEQRRQFDAFQKMLSPYIEGGNKGLSGQQDLLGLNGAPAQQTAISGLQASPQFAALQQQGENAILQNASATGGLRGGNTQGALAQFRPQLLNSLIDQQYQRLGGLAQMGQASAAGVGAAGQQTGSAISDLLAQQGAAQAGSALAAGKANSQIANSLGSAFGTYMGAKF